MLKMAAKQFLSNSLKAVLCGIGLLSTFFTVIDFTYFLSVPPKETANLIVKDVSTKISWDLLVNMFLLTIFILQHSILATQKIKDLFKNYGLQVAYRSLYVIATTGVLQLLMKNWHNSPEVVFWKINLNYRPVWWLYVSIHLISWILIYIGNICTDVTELLGLKQVYYSIVRLPDPSNRKSSQLQRLNAHMRHPSFLAFVIIFWFCQVMSIDRFLLAAIFSLYMYIAWNTDDNDYAYQKYQYQKKNCELERLHSHRIY